MSWLSGLAGLVGGVAGWSSAQQNMQMQKEMFDEQMAFNREQWNWQKDYAMNKNKYTVQDLKNAGINPMLAAGNLASGGGQTVGTPSAPSFQNAGQAAASSAASMIQAVTAIESIRNMSRKIDSEVEVNSARAAKDMADADYRRSELLFGKPQAEVFAHTSSGKQALANVDVMMSTLRDIGQRIKESEARVENLSAERQVKAALVMQLKASANDANSRAALSRAQTELVGYDKRLREAQAQTEHLRAGGFEIQNELMRYSVPESKASALWWNDFNTKGGKQGINGHDYMYWKHQYPRPNRVGLGPFGVSW